MTNLEPQADGAGDAPGPSRDHSMPDGFRLFTVDAIRYPVRYAVRVAPGSRALLYDVRVGVWQQPHRVRSVQTTAALPRVVLEWDLPRDDANHAVVSLALALADPFVFYYWSCLTVEGWVHSGPIG